MPPRLLRDRLGLSLPGLQFALLAWVLHPELGRPSWPPLTLLLCSGLFGFWRSLRHARLVDDTPTARIASAARAMPNCAARACRWPDCPCCRR